MRNELRTELQVVVVCHLRLNISLERAGREFFATVNARYDTGVRNAIATGNTGRRAQEVLVEIRTEERPRNTGAKEVRAGGALEVRLRRPQLNVRATEPLLDRCDVHLALVADRWLDQVAGKPIAAIREDVE